MGDFQQTLQGGLIFFEKRVSIQRLIFFFKVLMKMDSHLVKRLSLLLVVMDTSLHQILFKDQATVCLLFLRIKAAVVLILGFTILEE